MTETQDTDNSQKLSQILKKKLQISKSNCEQKSRNLKITVGK